MKTVQIDETDEIAEIHGIDDLFVTAESVILFFLKVTSRDLQCARL